MVSISTVARMVPRGMPSSRCAKWKTSFHRFRQIEVRPASLGHQGLGIVKEEKPEIEEAGRNGLAVHQEVLLIQMPAARPHH
jgi:hypothetical protein